MTINPDKVVQKEKVVKKWGIKLMTLDSKVLKFSLYIRQNIFYLILYLHSQNFLNFILL